MFECRIKPNEYPEEGEIVVARTHSTDENVLCMKLVEYGDTPGLVLSNELSKKRIRSMHQITKIGSMEVCQVLRVDGAKGHIDLSLKKVGEKEKKECLENASRNKLAYQIMVKAAKLANVPLKTLYEEMGYPKTQEYGSLYMYFVEMKDDMHALDKEKYGEYFSRVIEEQFKASAFKVRIDVDVTMPKDGVNAIKMAFRQASDVDDSLELNLLRTPTYSIVKVSDNKENGFANVNAASERVRKYVEEHGGTFAIACPAKVYGEKTRHTLLNETKNKKEVAGNEETSNEDESSQ